LEKLDLVCKALAEVDPFLKIYELRAGCEETAAVFADMDPWGGSAASSASSACVNDSCPIRK
jgi:hypothetical protein